jgi:hypothetical protein
MARILFWNIENFSSEKIAAASKKRARDDMEADSGPRGPAHLAMILSTMHPALPAGGGVAPLDFIVVVEVFQREGPSNEGQVVGGNAAAGLTALHAAIVGGVPGGAAWSLVPPIVTGAHGKREAIAVFYNSANWYFLGPQQAAGPYPAAWNAMLPAHAGAPRVVPVGYPYDPNPLAARQEARGQGQWQFPNGPPPVGLMAPAPAMVDFPAAGYRRPWLTAFGAVANPAVLVRIMAMHTTPNDRFGGPAWADQATTNLANCWDMTARLPDAGTQTDVIVGDFNVDNLAAASFAAGGPYARLIGVGPGPVAPPYVAAVQPPAGLAANHLSYYHTHGRPSYNAPGDAPARIADDHVPPPPNVAAVGDYPGLEYSGQSVDNALIRRHGGAAPAPNTTILARARQQPYNAPVPAPAVGPMLGHYGGLAYLDDEIDPLIAHWNGLAPHLAAANDINETFRDWSNYGLVRSVSDHFALLFDV